MVSFFPSVNGTGNALIGMNEKQGLACATTAGDNTSVSVELGFMGNSVVVAANATISDLR